MRLHTYRHTARIVRVRRGSLVLYRYDNADRLRDLLLMVLVAAPLMAAFIAAWVRSQSAGGPRGRAHTSPGTRRTTARCGAARGQGTPRRSY